MFDVCVIGPITRDVIRIDDALPREETGGVVQYAGMAFRSLGLDTAVITKAARCDVPHLVRGLGRIGVEVCCRDADATTVFENIYASVTLDAREQTVASIAGSFRESDLGSVTARVYHLGPLTRHDMDVGFLDAVSRRGGRVALDVQGFLRSVVDGKVRATQWEERHAGLARVDVLKADLDEARLLSGCEDAQSAARRIAQLGPSEVLVTLGRQGSLIRARGETYRIPAHPVQRPVDATGCGDTFLAGYLFHRLRSSDIAAAGRFAAALAALGLERWGPFTGTEGDVDAALSGRRCVKRAVEESGSRAEQPVHPS